MDDFSPPSRAPRAVRSLFLAVLLLLTLPPVMHGIGGAIVGTNMVNEGLRAAAGYDDRYDPVVIRNGTVSAGPRIVHFEEKGQTILVDPDETVPDTAVTTAEAIIVRRHEIRRIRPFREETHDVGELQAAFGIDEITIDSANLKAGFEGYRSYIVAAMAAFFALASFTDWVFLSIYALIGALVARSVLGEDQAPMRQGFALGLIVGLPTIALGWGLWAVGLAPGCFGPALWVPFIAAGTTLGMAATRPR